MREFTSDSLRASPQQLLIEAEAGASLACSDALQRVRDFARELVESSQDAQRPVSRSVTRCLRVDLFDALLTAYVEHGDQFPVTPGDLEGDLAIVADAKWEVVNAAQLAFVRRLLALAGGPDADLDASLEPEIVWGARLEIAMLLTDVGLMWEAEANPRNGNAREY